MLLSCSFVFVNAVYANELSARDAAILKEAGIPVHSSMQYVNGALSGIMGVRFASSANVNELRAWYQGKFPGWSVNDQFGTWILYEGEPGGGPAAYMTKKQVMIVENKNLQQWFSLPASMNTEVIIVVPE